MYGSNRAPYGGYGPGYWQGGYPRPPLPPPPPLIPSHNPHHPVFHHIPPLTPHFRGPRPPSHHLRPPPPPPPPPPSPPMRHMRIPFTQPQSFMPDRDLNPLRYQEGQEQQQDDSNQFVNINTSSNGFRSQIRKGLSENDGANTGGIRNDGDIANNKYPEKEKKKKNSSSKRKKDRSITLESSQGKSNKRPLALEIDPTLPSELIDKLLNNSCELCEVRLNSSLQARNHYEGRLHRKKVKNYISENLQQDGPPPAKVSKMKLINSKKKKSSDVDISQLYCKCCDLSFTSEQHAQQHYMGRNHQRVLYGLKPLKAGYYNKETAKWQRMPPDPRITAERIDLNLDPPSDDENTTDNGKKTSLVQESVKQRGRFFCEICKVSATSHEQLDGHMVGQRHIKAVRANAKKTAANTSGPTDSILASVIKGDETKKQKLKDFSIYRTPSDCPV